MEIFWNPKCQLMFRFCMGQEQLLIQKYGYQEKRSMGSPAISPPRKHTIPNKDSKSPAILPPRKDHNPNQDSNKNINKKIQLFQHS